MAIKDMKAKLENAAKNRKYKQANRDREEQVQLMVAQSKCRGELELCQQDFERTIRKQSAYIQEGEALGVDTSTQDQMLYDAAVGYLLVREAIYSLRTINTHNSISHAYGLMDLATRQMSGKKSGLPLKAIRDRSIYAYATSEEAYQKKCDVVDGFYEELRKNGDIEYCLNLPKKSEDQKVRQPEEDEVSYELPDRDEDPVDEAPVEKEKASFAYRGNPMQKGMDYDKQG